MFAFKNCWLNVVCAKCVICFSELLFSLIFYFIETYYFSTVFQLSVIIFSFCSSSFWRSLQIDFYRIWSTRKSNLLIILFLNESLRLFFFSCWLKIMFWNFFKRSSFWLDFELIFKFWLFLISECFACSVELQRKPLFDIGRSRKKKSK
jgi:hypothetical protein